MTNLGEFLRRRRADLAVFRLRAGELGERRFERAIAPAQFVIFGVGDRGLILAVIAPVVLGDLGPEARVLGPRLGEGQPCRFLFGRGHEANLAERMDRRKAIAPFNRRLTGLPD